MHAASGGTWRVAWRAAAMIAACWLAAVSGASSARAETRVALVIGNSAYAKSPLANPVHDADLMARTLRAVDFQVTLLLDADRASMQSAILEFGRQLQGADSVGLFYYAGHGVQIAGQNYLIPVKADIRTEREVAISAVNLAEVLDTIKHAESRLNIAVLDACRDNPFAATSRSGTRGLAPVDAPAGTLIAYATAPGQVAFDGDENNSPYTTALAANIPTPGATLEEVFKRTRVKVREATQNQQTPWEHSSLTGEFFFRPKQAEAEATQRPPPAAIGSAEQRLAEITDWERIKHANDPAAFRQHLERYPGGVFSELAAWRMSQLETSPANWTTIVTGANPEVLRDDPVAIYERGLKTEAEAKGPPELAQAMELFRKAADLGLPAAMTSIAKAYDKGRGVERNLTEAASWYRRAAEAGHPAAMSALGTMHEYGEGVAVDIGEAVRFYKAAAAQDDPAGMTSLAYLYAEGKGVSRDLKEARRLYTGAAERGQTRAMFNLALMMMRAEGGPPDKAEAVRLLQLAADRGHAGAMRELAYLYDEGRGVARNPKRAADLVLQAYKAKDPRARSDIAERPETWTFATRREVQKQLAAKGFYRGPTLGFFDERTRKALDKYAAKG